jgi:TonB family protein
MPLRALLFSKDPETNTVLTNVCQGAGVRLEVCDDIFNAMDKVKKMPFGVVFADWSCQPEAGFLVKRARESGPNKDFAAIAIVIRDPSAAEMNENRLQFLLHRPVAAEEARDMLACALQKVQPGAAANLDAPEFDEAPVAATAVQGASSQEPAADQGQQGDAAFSFDWSEDRPDEGESATAEEKIPARNYGPIIRQVFAGALMLTAVFFLWTGHDLMIGFVKSPEGKARVLRESVAAFFHLEPLEVMPVIGAKPEVAGGAAAPSTSDNSAAQNPQLQVVEGEPALDESHVQLRKAADFPLPTAQYVAPPPAPMARKTTIPDSIRGSAPIAPPVVVTVNPSQMMPVSTPPPPAPSSQTFTEPVRVSEEIQRSLLIRSVNPDYPAEAVPQKLHGPVVLQATIGRDGSVEDLKIVRGYFVLGKAAIAAVKQWQFKPYTLNGKPARTQTVITVNFDSPQS